MVIGRKIGWWAKVQVTQRTNSVKVTRQAERNQRQNSEADRQYTRVYGQRENSTNYIQNNKILISQSVRLVRYLACTQAIVFPSREIICNIKIKRNDSQGILMRAAKAKEEPSYR